MQIKNGPAAVKGFRFAGVVAGLKSRGRRKDLGLIVADRPAIATGVFTANRVQAAPVQIARERLRRGRLRAIVANSGSANCFTGKAGVKLAQDSCLAVGAALGCPVEMVVPCSTGVIGHLYDLGKFRRGVEEAVAALGGERIEEFARAIMTTDTRPKMAWVSLKLGGAKVTVAGTAKGSGMIAPQMATMLGFVLTDAAVNSTWLKSTLKGALAESFNAITVDGDMSTNDTVIMMASGAAGNQPLGKRDDQMLAAAVRAVSAALARQLVFDGEGATKLIRLEVRGAKTVADARRVARKVANSPLVKTAFFGCDPNVGRIVMAVGASGAEIDPERLRLWVAGVPMAARGAVMPGGFHSAAARMRQREFTVRVDLGIGKAAIDLMTSDLSVDYVKINAEYTT